VLRSLCRSDSSNDSHGEQDDARHRGQNVDALGDAFVAASTSDPDAAPKPGPESPRALLGGVLDDGHHCGRGKPTPRAPEHGGCYDRSGEDEVDDDHVAAELTAPAGDARTSGLRLGTGHPKYGGTNKHRVGLCNSTHTPSAEAQLDDLSTPLLARP
jgi:hypothetical protein